LLEKLIYNIDINKLIEQRKELIGMKARTNKLPESAEDFLNYLHMKNSSEGTINGYKSNLNIFFDFIKSYKKARSINNKTIKNIKLIDLYSFLNYAEKELGNSPATRARKVACLQSYFKYLYKKAKLIDDNIAEELDQIKIPKTKPITLDVKQSKQLLNACDVGALFYTRDKCILTFFLNCGLRLSELCNIKITDIRNDKLVVLGKGQKERDVYLNDDCIKVINEYLEDRQYYNIDGEEKEYLFITKFKKRIGKQAVELIVKKYLNKAELKDKKYSTHKLRGSFCTNAYRKGAGIKELMILMGHSNIGTTERYIDYNEDELKSAVKNIYD